MIQWHNVKKRLSLKIRETPFLDRFTDAFEGKIPRSILARHYTDCSLENPKAIYDRAGLRALEQFTF
jgi:hypothetical protein